MDKKSMIKDRIIWLKSAIATGDFKKIRELRKPQVPQQGRLCDLSGNLVFSDARVEILAEYLEKIVSRKDPVEG